MRRAFFIPMILVAAAIIVPAYLFLAARAPVSSSMTGTFMGPTLQDGQEYRIDTFFYEHNPVSRGDLVALRFNPDAPITVRRAVAVGGDTLEFRDGRIILNSIPLQEDYAVPEGYLFGEGEFSLVSRQLLPGGTVPQGNLLLLNDNREILGDSRSYGLVAERHVTGKVIL